MKSLSADQGGFSLIEVLITVIVLSIGLLGMAALQLASLRDSNRANERSIATVLAYDITDRMRANPAGVVAGDYLVDPDDPPVAPAVANGASAQDYCVSDFTGTATSDICNSRELASADVYDWFTRIGQSLPGGLGEILCTDADDTDTAVCSPGSRFVISVLWDDSRSDASGTDCDPAFEENLTCFSITTGL